MTSNRRNAVPSRCRRLAARLAVPILIALAAGGCATNTQLAKTVVDSNLAQELAMNQLVLLNVVRAYQRHPMHFSRISQLRLPTGMGNPKFTIPIPFGGSATNLYGLNSEFAVSQGVDTAVLDSQEFMQGITMPVPPSLMTYYLDQGWPQEMILHMFVRVIEIYRTEKAGATPVLVGRYENYPANADGFVAFQEAITGIRDCSLRLQPTSKATAYGPVLEARDLRDLQGIAQLRTVDVTVVPVDKDGNDVERKDSAYFRLAKVSKGSEFDFVDKLGKKCSGVPVPPPSVAAREPARAAPAPAPAPAAAGAKLFALQGGFAQDEAVGSIRITQAARRVARPGETTATHHANLVLRSPEAMVYYLGEIARAQLEGQRHGAQGVKVVPPRGTFPLARYSGIREQSLDSGNYVLFRVDRADGEAAAVKVEYAGNTYSIPASSDADRSMHVLSLVSQILTLQNKGKETPVTTNVRLVN